MQTLVFWSFKGGGGRTLTLANLACVLARLGKRVLCLDLDLEAPGLPRTLGESGGSEGFVEYAQRWIQTGTTANLAVGEIDVDLSRQVASTVPHDALLRVVYAGNYADPAGSRDYWEAVIGGALEVLFPLPRPLSLSGELVSASEIKTYETIYTGFWARLRQDLASLDPPPDYLLIDTRTGLSPLSRTSLEAFLGENTGEQGRSAAATGPRQLAIVVDPSSESSKTGTVEFLKRLPHPEVDVTIVQRAQPLLSPLTGSGAPEADWLGDASSMVKTIEPFSWDLRVERHGTLLIPPRGDLTYYPLLNDYLRVAAVLFPDIMRQPEVDPPVEDDDAVDFLRRQLGVEQPEPDDFKLFYLTSGGRMQNIKDDSPNISFQVTTFQSILDTLWDQTAQPGLPDDFGLALAAAGRTVGTEFGEALDKLAVDGSATDERGVEDRRKELVRLWCTFDSQVGWGRLEAEFPDDGLQSGEGVVLVWHNAFAEGREVPKNDLCTFMSGYIGGVLTHLLGHEVSVTHGDAEPCIRRGADHCAFRFGSGR